MRDRAIILAGGQGRRFGRPKQLARFEGMPLVRRSVALAERAGFVPLVVVGAHRRRVESTLSADTDRVFNDRWQQGMGSSIGCGIRWVMERAERSVRPRCIAICSCDQPCVDAEDLRRLRKACVVGGASAAAYADVVGIPACFSESVISDLATLSGDRGARDLLRGGSLEVAQVPVAGAAIDIDRPGDLDDARRFTAAKRSI